jgi:monoamine oxidase
MAGPLDRRRFLLAWAAAFAHGCGPGPLPPQRAEPSPRGRAGVRSGKRTVVVIGGGLAGLAAAHELVARGYDTNVLEAQARVGGRILTIRAPFRDGQFVEAGATHVVADPALLSLFRELNVTIEQRARTRGLLQVRHFGGMRRVLPADAEPPPAHALAPHEQTLGEQGCLDKYFALAKSVDPKAQPPPALSALDAISGAEYLRRQGASAGFIAMVDGMIGVGERGVEGMSALALVHTWSAILREIDLGNGGGKVAGGSDRLTDALAARLGLRVIREARVLSLEQSRRGVRVAFERRGELSQLNGARAILAVPPGPLVQLALQPALSPEKTAALRSLALESVTRVWLQADRRFWRERGESGAVESDLAMGGVREETDGLPGIAGILGLYTTRAAARQLAAVDEATRLQRALAHVQALQPGMAEHLVAGASKAWDADPFARGAYAWFGPGQLTRFAGPLTRPEGRIHFAGDHCSHRPGFMHGALASAQRAVSEIEAAYA